jgi:predicted secreted protein
MALITGNDGSLVVGSTTIAALRNFTVEYKKDTIETTTMASNNKTYIDGLGSWSGSADIYFDPTVDGAQTTATNGVFNLTNSTAGVGNDPVIAKFYVNQAAGATDIAYTGTCIVTGYSVKSKHDGLVEASLTFQGSGALNGFMTGTV